MDDKHLQFHLAEYNGLVVAFLQNAKDQYNSIIYPIITNAVIFAWISSNIDRVNQKNILTMAACLMPLISGASWFLQIQRRKKLNYLIEYGLILEKNYALDGFGYWSFYRSKLSKPYIGTSTMFQMICAFHSALTLYFVYFIWMTV